MAHTLDLRQMFITNLQLLGFDVGRMEGQTGIPFNRSMFDLPNKKGAEVVLHFLFSRLNPVMCAEEFRYCWPIIDKKTEQQFRKGCTSWLTNIAKEEADAHLPRISAALLMSPGGNKFCELLFHFSRYVLLQVTLKHNGVKDKDLLRYPVLTSQTESYGDVIAEAVKCSVVRQRKVFLDVTHSTLFLNKKWKDLSSELVREHRRLTKDCRELDHQIRDEVNRGAERGHTRGSPVVRKRKSTSFDYDNDRQSIKRSQRLQDLREMWKKFDDFCSTEASEREVIESIVDRTMTKYRVDGSEINIKVPDLLLRECQEEIRRRHIDNTFQHGKLNLVSLIQLWNLCLHLYKERLHSTGVPNFTNDVESVSKQVHTSHAYVTNVQSLRTEIGEIIPDLKESITGLQRRLDSDGSLQSTPRGLRTTCVGLGLMEPSPGISFTPEKHRTGQTPTGSVLRLTPENVSTPEAVVRISEAVSKATRRGKVSKDGNVGARKEMMFSRVPLSKVPRKVANGGKQQARTVDVRSQLQSTPTKKQPSEFAPYSLDSDPHTLMSQEERKNLSFSSGVEDINSPVSTPRSLLSNQSTPRNKSDQSGSSHSTFRSKDEQLLSSQSTPRSKKEEPVSNQSTPQNRSMRSLGSNHSHASSPLGKEDRDSFLSPEDNGKVVQSQPSPSELLVNEILGLVSPALQARGVEGPLTSPEKMNPSPLSDEIRKMFRESLLEDQTPRSASKKTVRTELFDSAVKETGNETNNNLSTLGGEPQSRKHCDDITTNEDGDENLDEIQMPDILLNSSVDELFHFETSPVSEKQDIFSYTENNESDIEVTGSLGSKCPPKPKFPLVDAEVDDRFMSPSVSHLGMDTSDTIPKHINTDFANFELDREQKDSSVEQESNRVFNSEMFARTVPVKLRDADCNDPSRDWHELENSMDQLDSLLGKSPDSQKSFEMAPGVQGTPRFVDDLDIIELENLDDSFVPLKDGFQLDGGTPAKIFSGKVNMTKDVKNETGDHSDNGSSLAVEGDRYEDIISRFQQLKAQTLHIKQKYNINAPESDV